MFSLAGRPSTWTVSVQRTDTNCLFLRIRSSIMVGRREFGALGLTAAAALAFKSAVAADKDDKDDAHGQHGAFMKCANACNDCQRECDTCADHCAQLLVEGK